MHILHVSMTTGISSHYVPVSAVRLVRLKCQPHVRAAEIGQA